MFWRSRWTRCSRSGRPPARREPQTWRSRRSAGTVWPALARSNWSFFCYCYGDHRDLHSFPTRRSSDLYDIEFWGPDGMCASFYLGALKAASIMGKQLGDETPLFAELHEKGVRLVESDLYNGEYFIQKIGRAHV